MQMMQPTTSRLRQTVVPELALLLLLALLWGGSYPLTKLALQTIPPFTLVALRVTIAAVLLLVIAWWHMCPSHEKPASRVRSLSEDVSEVLVCYSLRVCMRRRATPKLPE